MLLRITALATLGVAAAGAYAAWPAATGNYALTQRHAFPLTAQPYALNKPVLDVLFVGNSFTFEGDLPGQFVNLAASDPGLPVRVRMTEAVIPGATLKQDWEEGEGRRRLAAHAYDYVVLQQQSAWALHSPWIEDTRAALSQWTQAARAAGARPVLFGTWADKAGGPLYEAGAAGAGLTPDGAQARLSQQGARLAAERGLRFVDVGARFTPAERSGAAPELFQGDGHHPTTAGSFLSALVFYRALTGRDPAQTTRWSPPGMTAAERGALLRAAAAI